MEQLKVPPGTRLNSPHPPGAPAPKALAMGAAPMALWIVVRTQPSPSGLG